MAMKKRIRKNDLIFLGIVAALVFLVYLAMVTRSGSIDESMDAGVEITVDGELYGVYPLQTDTEITIAPKGETANVLVIAGGQADMREADCPDKLCVHQRAISKTNETIVCLPNRVVVTVVGGRESEIDSIAK